MNTNSPHVEPLIRLRPDELRVGMYIDLDCSWFRHPFPRKAFKLTSPHQLETIRGLGLATVLVNRQLSDASAWSDGQSASMSVAAGKAPSTGLTDAPSAVEYCVARHREADAYRQILRQGSAVLKGIAAGSEEGMADAKQMIVALSALIVESGGASAMSGLVAMEETDQRHVLHALNVSTLAMTVAHHMGMTDEALQVVGMAGLLHDIGEYRVPVSLRRKQEGRSPAERKEFQRHPAYSLDILQAFPSVPEEVRAAIRDHHLRLDGSGYPSQSSQGLSRATQVLLVVDAYEEILNPLPGTATMTPFEALSHMYMVRKEAFPQDVVVALIQTVGVYPPGTVVELSDGRQGLVVSRWTAYFIQAAATHHPSRILQGHTKQPTATAA